MLSIFLTVQKVQNTPTQLNSISIDSLYLTDLQAIWLQIWIFQFLKLHTKIKPQILSILLPTGQHYSKVFIIMILSLSLEMKIWKIHMHSNSISQFHFWDVMFLIVIIVTLILKWSLFVFHVHDFTQMKMEHVYKKKLVKYLLGYVFPWWLPLCSLAWLEQLALKWAIKHYGDQSIKHNFLYFFSPIKFDFQHPSLAFSKISLGQQLTSNFLTLEAFRTLDGGFMITLLLLMDLIR